MAILEKGESLDKDSMNAVTGGYVYCPNRNSNWYEVIDDNTGDVVETKSGKEMAQRRAYELGFSTEVISTSKLNELRGN